MFTEEDIECWNDIFKEGKIQDADIKTPTTSFLVKTLYAYLQKFGYKIDSLFAINEAELGGNSREKRLFLTSLARNIDRILKYTDETFGFMYYDLIRPVSKKTSHTLGILLNTYFYYDVFKKDVFAIGNDRIKSREDLLQEIESTKQMNEERKQLSEQIHVEIEELSHKVPSAESELEIIRERKSQQDEKFKKINFELEHLNKRYVDLHAQCRFLKNQVVDNNRALQLKQEIVDLEAKIKERQSQQNSAQVDQIKRLEKISHAKALQTCLSKCKELFPLKQLEDLKNIESKLKQCENLSCGMIRERNALYDKIAKQMEELNALEEKYKKKKQLFEIDKTTKNTTISELTCQVTNKTKELEQLHIQLNAVNNEINDQKDMQKNLNDTISSFMQFYIG